MSRVFWTQAEGFKSFVQGTNDVPDPLIIDEKVKSAFSKLKSFNDGVIQFWAPIKTAQGRLVLTISETAANEEEEEEQGDEEEEEEEKYKKYKVTSRIYRYSIINDDVEYEQRGNRKESAVLPNSPAASAFLNCFPEVVFDSSDAFPDMCLYLRYAMEEVCDLTCFFMLPVFYGSFCVGVVECCMEKVCLTDGRFFSSFKLLKQALKSVGLGTFGVEECQLYKTISGLGHATHEIEKALEIVCEAHDLAVAQVWIPYENESRVTSLTGTVTKQMLAVRLGGSCGDSDDDLMSPIKDYYNISEMLPFELGDGLVGSALQTNEPHFCKNIYELPMTTENKKKPLQKMSSVTKCSCFFICLRSIDTGDLDYVFEFLWPRSRNHVILLESLLLTLKSCLPNFKFASGEQLGDKLRVVDFENSTGSGNGFFKILEGNKISPILKPLEGKRLEAEDCRSSSGVKCNTPRECTRQQYGRPTNENAENLKGWQPTNFVKRKLSDVYESESDSNDDSPNQDILIINAEYADDVFKIHLPISSATLAVVKEEINKRCNLNSETCKLEYLDEDEEWILMTSDAHLRRCISCWRSVDGTHIRLRLLPFT